MPTSVSRCVRSLTEGTQPLTCAGTPDPLACAYLADAFGFGRDSVRDLCQVDINPLLGLDPNDGGRAAHCKFRHDAYKDDFKTRCDSSEDKEPNECPYDRNLLKGFLAQAGGKPIEDVKHEMRLISSISGNLKSKAFRNAYEFTGYVPKDHHIRRVLADFSLLAAEYSNQIQSRNVVLAAQLGEDGTEASKLPVSDYLRDASNTDFLKLYDWYQATSEPHHKPHYPPLRPAARVRAAERLFNDYYWEKINEVYASGLGKASMAFIKNAVGNWELKSFSNDPTELLEAYGDVASAALSSAEGLAGGGGGVAAKMAEKASVSERFLALANTAATGRASGTAAGGGANVAGLHERAKASLVTQQEGLEKEEKAVLEKSSRRKKKPLPHRKPLPMPRTSGRNEPLLSPGSRRHRRPVRRARPLVRPCRLFSTNRTRRHSRN